MTIINWGSLVKDSTDSETIEQAIARIVAEHNDEPTAHMADGQAIDLHRKDTTVDHPAGSIFADKETMSEFKTYDYFSTLDGWGIVGDVFTAGFSAGLTLEHGVTEASSMLKGFDGIINFIDSNKDFLFQTNLRIYQGSGGTDGFIGINSTYSISTRAIGFKIANNVLSTYIKHGSTVHEVTLSSVSVITPHIYRVQYIAGERTFYFFIDGVLVDSYVLPTGVSLAYDGIVCYSFDVYGNPSDSQIFISTLFVARGS